MKWLMCDWMRIIFYGGSNKLFEIAWSRFEKKSMDGFVVGLPKFVHIDDGTKIRDEKYVIHIQQYRALACGIVHDQHSNLATSC